jgi:hypothetical protein
MFIADFVRKVWNTLPWRRSHVRTPTALTVDWRVDGSRSHHVSPICDVSQGGAFVCTPEPARVGAPLVLEVVTPTGWVQVKARVAWHGEKGMGVRFCPE